MLFWSKECKLMPTVPISAYPTLATIANLVRSLVNDDGLDGAGRILTNKSVTLQNFMNSAIRDLYRDLRIMGDPALIKDNYIINGLPPLNSPSGVGVPNAEIQVSLSQSGYFDGLQLWPNYTLPSDMIMPLEMWQRQNGTSLNFTHLPQANGPLTPNNQGLGFGKWEWRNNQIWMNGSIIPIDLRLRYISTYIDLAEPNINWDYTYVPITDSQDVIADKVVVQYCFRLGGDALADARLNAKQSLLKVKQQSARVRQKINITPPIYGHNRAENAGDASQWLY